MGEARRADLAAVGLVGAIGDEIDAKLTFWGFHARIHLACWHMIAFRIKLEMVDQRLHRAFHFGALRRYDFLAFGGYSAALSAQFVAALAHQTNGLAHFFHADEIAVIAVAVLADGDIEFQLVVTFIGLGFAQVPGRARAAHHDARKTPGEGVFQGHHRDIHITLLEYTIVREQHLNVIKHLEERVAKGLDVIDKLGGQILMHAARAKIGRVHA